VTSISDNPPNPLEQRGLPSCPEKIARLKQRGKPPCSGWLSLLLLLFFNSVYSQSTETDLKRSDPTKKFSVYVYGTYVSSSELQENPKSSDPIERDATIELDGGFGYGGEIIYDPGIYDLGIKLYLSLEFLKIDQRDLEMIFDNGAQRDEIQMRERFTLIPVELGVKWLLPVSGEEFKIYIGGGVGIYFGSRTRNMGNLESSTLDTKPGFSLNILSGIEYFFARNLSADFELKFREASFDAENKFSQNSIDINGTIYPITNPFYSRLIVDGVRLSLGIKYHF
jgi:hypothetical protein